MEPAVLFYYVEVVCDPFYLRVTAILRRYERGGGLLL